MKRLLLFLTLMASFGFASLETIQLPSDGEFKEVTYGAVTAKITYTDVNFIYPDDRESEHWYIIIAEGRPDVGREDIITRENNAKKIVKKDLELNKFTDEELKGIELYEAVEWTEYPFLEEGIINRTYWNITYKPAMGIVAPDDGEAVYLLKLSLPRFRSGDYNVTMNIEGQNFFLDPEVSACGALDAGSYTLTADIDNDVDYCFSFNGGDVDLNGQGHYIDGDNTGSANYDAPFSFSNDDNVTVYNFSFVREFHHGTYYSGGSNITVRDMVITNMTGDGVRAGDVEDGCIIQNLTIHGNGARGIDVEDINTGATYLIDSVTVYNNTDTGIFIPEPYVTLRHSNISNGAGSTRNLHVMGDNVTVWNNTIENGPTHSAFENADNTIVVNNTFINDSINAYTSSTGINITGNRIENVAGTAIAISLSSDNAIIEGNTIVNATTGISVSNSTGVGGANNKIVDVTVYYNITITPANFTYLTLGNRESYGYVNFSDVDLEAGDSATEGTNIHLEDEWVSINETALVDLDVASTVTLYNPSCGYGSAMNQSGFPTSREEIIAGDTYNESVSCSGDVTSFPVDGFSGYALGESDAFSINVTLANASETQNESVTVNVTGLSGNISRYNITFTYNNTLIINFSTIGGEGPAVNQESIEFSDSVIAPLVASNNTLIPWYANVTVTIGGSNYTGNISGNQTVELHYYAGAYTLTPASAYTVEESNSVSVTIPTAPATAPENVTYDSYTYALENCTWVYANTTETNTTCENTLTVSNISAYTINPSHSQEDGLIYSDIWTNKSYDISFNATAESASSKTIGDGENVTREYFVWIVESNNGTIDGAGNLTTIFNITFYLEADLSNTTANSVVSSYTVTFPDDVVKNYTISYSGTLHEAIVRGYPDFYVANLSSIEVYSKTSHTTRGRFLIYESNNLSVLENVSIYFLDDASADYAIINVIDNGEAVAGAYVHILKYYANTTLYTEIDQKITNSEGRTAGYYDVDAYYRFVVYDSDGDQVYSSTQPEQFICDTTCEITLNIADQDPIDLIGPHTTSGTCYGNVTTNSIIFSYADATGQVANIRFLAFRANTTTAVCNNTISGSSGGYVCVLGGSENLSNFVYTCRGERSTSPYFIDFVEIIDERTTEYITDWIIVTLVFAVGIITGGIVHMSVGAGLAGISVFALSALGIAELSYDVSVPILIVCLVTAFILAKRD